MTSYLTDSTFYEGYLPEHVEEVDEVLTPSFGSELSGGRPETLRVEATTAGAGRRPPKRRRRGLRRALGVRLVSAGLHLIGGRVDGVKADVRAVATHVGRGR